MTADNLEPEMPDEGMEFTEPPRASRGTNKRIHADTMQRVDKVWNARIAGATWKQAAELGGYSTGQNAATAVRSLRDQIPVLEREHARDLWRERLEVLWKQALRDVIDQRPGAVTAAVRVVTAATQLDGLNNQTPMSGPVTAQFNQMLLFIEKGPDAIQSRTVTGEVL